MKYEVNECCDCATDTYPCIGDSCSLRHATYYKCDRCGCDGLTEDEIHEVDGEDLCDYCYDEEFSDDEDDSPCYECTGYGDDYRYDAETDDIVCNCDDCPCNPVNQDID